MSPAPAMPRRPSLRRRLLLVLLVPMAILLILDALLTYGVALTYANRVHDRDLSDDAVMLAKMLADPGLGTRLLPAAAAAPPDNTPQLYSTRLDGHALRAAAVRTTAPSDPSDNLLVTVAETLHDRHQQANEILLLSIMVQTTLIAAVLSLVWFGVGRGLRV